MSVILSTARKNENGQPQNGRRNRPIGGCLPRSRAGAVHVLPPDGRSPRADRRSVAIPDLSGMAQRRQGDSTIQRSGNGILFAAGSCWEGIDFPGDMVSLLIIAKLPFPIPDPVSDYERHQYPNLRDYINAEIIPEMQKKLRQGFGRAIRTEQDSCVVAILDERAGFGGKYHDAALAALPSCPTTEKIEDVQQFIREQKRPDYFL